MMRALISLGTVQCEVEVDCGYSSDPLDDICRRVVKMAAAMLEVESATRRVQYPDVPAA